MNVADAKKNAGQEIQKSIEALKTDLVRIRTDRVYTGLPDYAQVGYYGSMVPISQVTNVTLVDARTIGVQPWEKKMVQAVEKVIREVDLGLNPTTMGDIICVPVPAPAKERRKELTKVVKGEGEGAKVATRDLCYDANEQLKKLVKDKMISEDDECRGGDDVQKPIDRFVTEVDKLIAEKDEEIAAV